MVLAKTEEEGIWLWLMCLEDNGKDKMFMAEKLVFDFGVGEFLWLACRRGAKHNLIPPLVLRVGILNIIN